MSNAPNFNNNATQRERAEIVREERKLRRGEREGTTYHRLAGLGDELGGRFREKETITGEQAATQYPRQDSASPWSGGGADPGVEPSLGYSINDLEATGTAAEIEASLVEAVAPAERVRKMLLYNSIIIRFLPINLINPIKPIKVEDRRNTNE